MKIHKPTRTAALLAVLASTFLVLLALHVRADAPPSATDTDKPDPEKIAADLTKAFKDADVVFTAKIGKVKPLGHTNSIPASIFGNVAFKDLTALHGTLPEAATFSFSYREGMTQSLDLEAEGQVVVAVKKTAVTVVAPATEANLALARKAVAETK